jgi:adenylyltransferase/sulfurtransferase
MTLSDRLKKRYSRQTLIEVIGIEGQEKLSESHAVVIGLGALGGAIATMLARAGVGRLKLVDRDFVELDNLHRQILYDENDLDAPKATAASAKLEKINSDIKINSIINDVNYSNVEHLIEGADVVVDGTDNMETRFLINDACVKGKIPWVYGGAVGTTGMTMNIIPDKSACFRCFVHKIPPPGSLPTCDNIGVINAIPMVIGSIQSVEALKIMLGKQDLNENLIIYDIWNHDLHQMQIPRNPDCKCCISHEFEFLKIDKRSIVTSICGTNSVQVTPIEKGDLEFDELKSKLSAHGEIKQTSHTLIFKITGYKITIFRDGRTLIKGTQDEKLAKSLYAKYIGT